MPLLDHFHPPLSVDRNSVRLDFCYEGWVLKTKAGGRGSEVFGERWGCLRRARTRRTRVARALSTDETPQSEASQSRETHEFTLLFASNL